MLNIISYRLYQVDSLDQVQIILINLMFVPVNLQGESVVHSCPVAAAVRKEAAAAASSIQHPQPLRSLAEPLSSSSIQPLNFSNPLSSCAGRSNGRFKDSSLYQEPPSRSSNYHYPNQTQQQQRSHHPRGNSFSG